jgi:transcriptional regulator GlxA family with amidase domain
MPNPSATLIKSAASPLTIGVLAFDGISPFHLSVPSLVFGDLHKYADTPEIRLRVCSQAGTAGNHKIRTSAGYTLETKYGLSTLRRADIIIIPSWHEDLRTTPDELIKLLRLANKNGTHIVGLCLGAFVLADAGLLNQREATTHWALAQEFASRYPQVHVKPDVLYVDQDKITTSAGTAAGIDCCLHLLRTYFGAGLANQVARRLVVAPIVRAGKRNT